MKPFIYNHIIPPQVKRETTAKLDKVDRGGYIPLNKQIDLLIQSGELLEAHRRRVAQNGLDVPIVNPFTKPNYDLTDGQQATDYVKNIKEKVEAAEKEIKKQNKKNIQTPSTPPNKTTQSDKDVDHSS